MPSSTLRKRKRLKAIVCCAVVVLGFLTANHWMLMTAARANPASRVNWLFQSPAEHFDVAILGSSLSKEGIDPAQLAQLTGKRIAQLAWGGRGVSEQSLYWELFLERHSCDTLLLELHPRGLEQDVLPHPLDEFRYVPHLANPIVRRHLIRHCGWTNAQVWRWIPMWAMAEFSTQIGWHDVLAVRRGEQFSPNAPADNVHLGDTEAMQDARIDTKNLPGATPESPEALECFKEILDICQARGIRVIGYYPPLFQGNATDKDQAAIARYQELLDDSVTLLGPSSKAYMQDAANFQDAFHLNQAGSQFFTEDLADQIR